MGETPALTFGEELRRERLIRDVSLEEISAATKISMGSPATSICTLNALAVSSKEHNFDKNYAVSADTITNRKRGDEQ